MDSSTIMSVLIGEISIKKYYSNSVGDFALFWKLLTLIF